ESPPAPPPPPKNEPPSPVYAYATGGLAVVAIGVGSIFGVRALSSESEYSKNPSDDTRTDGQGFAAVSTTSFVVAGLLAGATVLILLAPRPKTDTAAVRFTPVIRF